MKNPLYRNTLISAALHIGVIVALLLLSTGACRRARKPKEITMMTTLVSSMPQQARPNNEQDRKPPPPKPPDPKPVPPKDAIAEPKPPPKPKPEQPPPKPKPETPKPKPQPDPPKQPPLTDKQVKDILSRSFKPSDLSRAISTSPGQFDWYYDQLREILYGAWMPPRSLSKRSGLVTVVVIRVFRDGTIGKRELRKSSGNPLMDQSAMDSVQSVSRVDPLPKGLGGAYEDITVDFELTEDMR